MKQETGRAQARNTLPPFELFEANLLRPTVFIHGNMASSRWWRPSLEIIKEKNLGTAKAILADWRGYGKSLTPDNIGDLHPAKLATDYVKILKTLKSSSSDFQKFNIVGHSAGGLISLFCLLEAPELFSKALLLNPVGATGLKVTAEKLKSFSLMKDNKEHFEKVMATTIHNVDCQNPLFKEIIKESFKASDLNWKGVPEAFSQIDITSKLHQIHNFVHVIHGEYDTILPIEDSRQLAQLLPNAHFSELKGAGHSPNIEIPEIIAKEVVSLDNF